VAVVSVLSCAKSKAAIDYTLSEGIVWPGEPEKPRIKYLWSLHSVSGGGDVGRLLRFMAGEPAPDGADPRESLGLVRPHSVFVDDGNRMYITDMGAMRVSVIDLNTMDSFNIDRIVGDIMFASPIGVVADPGGMIYVTDANLALVLVFDSGGSFVRKFEGQFKRPTGIAINPVEGLIYISDTWAHTIYIYGLDGKKKGSFGQRGEGPGELNYPTHIAVDRDGYVYVSDTLNFKVQIFTGWGEPVNSFGLVGDSFDTFDKMKGIAVDSEGHIFVADSAQDMVKIYDKEGRLLLFFGRKGHFYGRFYLPAGLFIDGGDRIFVSDSVNRRVQAFKFLGGDGNADGGVLEDSGH
jgi:DNA-binding beta-propeller fold protein YncE